MSPNPKTDWQSQPRVAILVETSKEYGRGLIKGIVQYARTKANWTIYFDERGLDDPAPPWFESWHGDGILLRGRSLQTLELAQRSQASIVNLGEIWTPGLPSVGTDEEAVGIAAAEHLLERGLQLFACFEIEGASWSYERAQAFTAAINHHRPEADVRRLKLPAIHRMDVGSWSNHYQLLHTQLASLPQPTGVFASYDVLGVRVIQACRDMGISVPDGVAVIGADNDELLCELATPAMTSIPHRTVEIGYQAASMLDKLMSGKPLTCESELIPPSDPVIRHSTETLAIDDDHVVAAIRFIASRASVTITPDQIAEHCRLSRGFLEKRFKTAVGDTIAAYLLKRRLLHAKELLLRTDMKLWQIAEDTGFKHAEYFSVVFKREIGMTPRQFRTSYYDVK